MDNSGIRIQKVLSDNGVMSRRKAEEAILKRRVEVNGRPAKIGQKINPRKDIIAIDGVNIQLNKRKQNVYIMLNKPRGYVTTTSDEMGRTCVLDLVADAPQRVYPVGRLDKTSEGLLLLTNDGGFADSIMHPRGHISKTYRATVKPGVTEDQLLRLSSGVEIDGVMTLPATVHVVAREPERAVIQITIFEGKNRQIRKMCEALGLEVARLKRVSVGPLKLGMLKTGKWRLLTASELTALRNCVQKATNRQKHEESEAKSRKNKNAKPDKRGK